VTYAIVDYYHARICVIIVFHLARYPQNWHVLSMELPRL